MMETGYFPHEITLFTNEGVPLVEFMYLNLHACQVRVTVSDSGLCYVFRALTNSLNCALILNF